MKCRFSTVVYTYWRQIDANGVKSLFDLPN